MLRQKQAKLLEEIFLLVCNGKGMKVAEELLQLLLTENVTTRSQVNTYLSSFLQDDAYVIKYLKVKNDDIWLQCFADNILDKLLIKYEEVKSWKLE